MTGVFTAYISTGMRTTVLRTNPHRTRTCRKVTKTSGDCGIYPRIYTPEIYLDPDEIIFYSAIM